MALADGIHAPCSNHHGRGRAKGKGFCARVFGSIQYFDKAKSVARVGRIAKRGWQGMPRKLSDPSVVNGLHVGGSQRL